MFATRKQSPVNLFSFIAAIPLKYHFDEVYMSLPEGKAIYLIAFNTFSSYIRKLTDQPTTHPALVFYVKMCLYICSFQILIYTFAMFLKNQCLIKILNVMEKYYLCSIQSKTTPGANEAVLVPIEEISAFVSSNLRPDCLLFISYCSTFKAIPDEK